MTEESLQPEFGPYLVYSQNRRSVEEFDALTGWSHDLTQQLLFKQPREQLAGVGLDQLDLDAQEGSYGPADGVTREQRVLYGGFSHRAYAERCNLELERV